MASRKDRGGRLLRKGESYRESDGMYIFTYTDSSGKRRYTYSKSLLALRDKERAILQDKLDGMEKMNVGQRLLRLHCRKRWCVLCTMGQNLGTSTVLS